jgi:hypothetical protein
VTIAIHVERLVLDSLPSGPHDAETVSAALEAELTRLVAAHGLDISRGFSVPHLQFGSIDVDRATTSMAVGQGVARALYDGVASSAGADRPAGATTEQK